MNAIKCIYKLKRFSKKEYCQQYRHVKFKGITTKWPVQSKPTEQHKNTQDALAI